MSMYVGGWVCLHVCMFLCDYSVCFHVYLNMYINLPVSLQVTVPTERVTITQGNTDQGVTTVSYLVINADQVSVDPSLTTRPLYWSVPTELLGDKVCKNS